MKNYFKSQFGTSNMFRFNSSNELKINGNRFDKAMGKANSHQKTLLEGMKKAINVNDVAKIKVNKNSSDFVFRENITTGYDKNDNQTYDFSQQGFRSDKAGFTLQAQSISYTMIGINNAEAEQESMSAGNASTGGDPSAIFMHEVLDEFYNFYSSEKTINGSSTQTDKVYYQNEALKNKNLPPRDGLDHEKK